MLELKSVQTQVIWGGTSEFAKSNRWNGGVRSVYVIHYISKGSGTLETEGKTFRLTAGDSFIIYPDTYVKYYPDENDPWEYAWVGFNGIEAERLLQLTDFKNY